MMNRRNLLQAAAGAVQEFAHRAAHATQHVLVQAHQLLAQHQPLG